MNETTLTHEEEIKIWSRALSRAEEEIISLHKAIKSAQRSAFDAGYDAARDGRSRLIAYGLWSNESNTDA